MDKIQRLFVVLKEVEAKNNNNLTPKSIYGGTLYYTETADTVIIVKYSRRDLPPTIYKTTKDNLQVCEELDCDYVWMLVNQAILESDELMGVDEKLEARIVVRGKDVTVIAYPDGWTRTFNANVVCEMAIGGIPRKMVLNAYFNFHNEFKE